MLTASVPAFAGECIDWDAEACAICVRELAQRRVTANRVIHLDTKALQNFPQCQARAGTWGCFRDVCLVEAVAKAVVELDGDPGVEVRQAASSILGLLRPWRVCDGEVTVPALKLLRAHYPEASPEMKTATRKVIGHLYTEGRGMARWARPCHTLLRDWMKDAPEGLREDLQIAAAKVAMWEEDEAVVAPLRAIPAIRRYAESRFPLPDCLKSYFGLEQQGMLRYIGDELLRRLRNAVFARHGRRFKDLELQKFFDAQPWYKARDDFSMNKLDRGDRINIKLTKQEGKRRNKAK